MYEGIELLSKAVGSTMGPSGKTVIIHEEGEEPYVTKDGVTVAESISHPDPVKNAAIQLVKKVSSKMQQENGDGTTGVMVICSELIRLAFDIEEDEDFNPYEFKIAIEECLAATIEELQANKKEINISDIRKIATISGNNDEEIGDLFQKAYDQTGKNGYINIVESVTGKSDVKIIDGFVIDYGYPERKYANNKITNFFEAQKAHVIIYDGDLSDRKQINDIMKCYRSKAVRLPVLLFAKDFSKDVLDIIDYNNIDVSGIKTCPIKNTSRNQEYQDLIQDISNYTGAEIVQDFENSYIEGTVENLVVKQGYTVFGKPNDTQWQLLKQYISELELAAAAEASAYIAEDIKKRISKMTNGITTIYVGGNSDIELLEKKHRIDDAHNACKAALENGIIIGGGQSLLTIANQNDEGMHANKYKKVFFDAITAPFFQILKNSNHTDENAVEISAKIDWKTGYNAKSRKFEDLMETGIVDPVKIVVDELINAVSIATTILSTECLIVNVNQYEATNE